MNKRSDRKNLQTPPHRILRGVGGLESKKKDRQSNLAGICPSRGEMTRTSGPCLEAYGKSKGRGER